jgi:uncharacterized damage-inducible protein DinB
MDALALLRDAFHHMEWADALTWACVLPNASLSGDGVVRARLHHIHLVQRAFLYVWRGEPLVFEGSDALSSAALSQWARAYHQEARTFLAALDPTTLQYVVALPWAGRISETQASPYAAPRLVDTVLQVTAHSSHHRGQVLARIHELGVTPPLTDYIAWAWSGQPSPAWPESASV